MFDVLNNFANSNLTPEQTAEKMNELRSRMSSESETKT